MVLIVIAILTKKTILLRFKMNALKCLNDSVTLKYSMKLSAA